MHDVSIHLHMKTCELQGFFYPGWTHRRHRDGIGFIHPGPDLRWRCRCSFAPVIMVIILLVRLSGLLGWNKIESI